MRNNIEKHPPSNERWVLFVRYSLGILWHNALAE